jgi:hypothetical protein
LRKVAEDELICAPMATLASRADDGYRALHTMTVGSGSIQGMGGRPAARFDRVRVRVN